MWAFGLKIAAIGIGVVFVALIFISFLINIQTAVLTSFAGKKKEESKVEQAPTPTASQPVVQQNDDELIAVIAAAVAAAGFSAKIKTIKRISGSNGSIWSTAGRTDAMNLRQF